MAEVPVCHAELCLYGDALDPDALSGILGLEPHTALRKGAVRHTRTGRRIVQRTGVWIYGTAKADGAPARDADPETHVRWLLAAALDITPDVPAGGPRCAALRAHATTHGLDVRVSVFWHGRFVIQAPKVTATLRALVQWIPARLTLDCGGDDAPLRNATFVDRNPPCEPDADPFANDP